MPALAVLFPAHVFGAAFATLSCFAMLHIAFLLVDMANVLGAARLVLHAALFRHAAHALLAALCLLAFVILLLHKEDFSYGRKELCQRFFLTRLYVK